MRHSVSLLFFAIALAASNLSYGQCGGPVPLLCDADADRDVDSADIAAIGQAHGTAATSPADMRDIDGDGTITVLDARQCVARCSEEQCSVPADLDSVYAVANSCVAISPDGSHFLTPENTASDTAQSEESAWVYSATAPNAASGSKFLRRPSDLGNCLLFDGNKHYLTSDGEQLVRQSSLASDTREVEGDVVIEPNKQSEGEWRLGAAVNGQCTLQQ